ncbi:MAG: hypothetical protein ABID35_00870 [Candidatus Margulisiibacteriota bacterium]
MLVRSLQILLLVLFLQFSSFAESRIIPFQIAKERTYFNSPQLTLDSVEYNTLILRLEAQQSGSGIRKIII